MVKYSHDKIFAALSQSTRRDILKRVAMKPLTVSGIAKPYRISLPAVSKHLKIMEHAGLVSRRRQGRESSFTANLAALNAAVGQLTSYSQFWHQQLTSLDKYLSRENKHA